MDLENGRTLADALGGLVGGVSLVLPDYCLAQMILQAAGSDLQALNSGIPCDGGMRKPGPENPLRSHVRLSMPEALSLWLCSNAGELVSHPVRASASDSPPLSVTGEFICVPLEQSRSVCPNSTHNEPQPTVTVLVTGLLLW